MVFIVHSKYINNEEKAYYISFIIFPFFLVFEGKLIAQQNCGTMAFDSLRRDKYPLPSLADFEDWLSEKMTQDTRLKSDQVYRIPVIVYVVRNGENPGEGANISYEQVVSQIQVLNEDFRRMPGTRGDNDDPVGVDTGIEFYLAEYDPDGKVLEEPGIDRIYGGQTSWPSSPLRNPIETKLKPATIWDPERYVDSGSNLLINVNYFSRSPFYNVVKQ